MALPARQPGVSAIRSPERSMRSPYVAEIVRRFDLAHTWGISPEIDASPVQQTVAWDNGSRAITSAIRRLCSDPTRGDLTSNQLNNVAHWTN